MHLLTINKSSGSAEEGRFSSCTAGNTRLLAVLHTNLGITGRGFFTCLSSPVLRPRRCTVWPAAAPRSPLLPLEPQISFTLTFAFLLRVFSRSMKTQTPSSAAPLLFAVRSAALTLANVTLNDDTVQSANSVSDHLITTRGPVSLAS